MSLVNDMLRDLDARRRDAPARGAGAEKLVPASDGGTDGHGVNARSQRLVMAAVILLASAAGVAVALYLGARPGDGGPGSLPVSREPAEAALVRTGEDGDSITADGDDRTDQQLQALAARLEQLEAENRRLRQDEGADTSPPDDTYPSAADSGSEREWEPRDWSSPVEEDGAETSSLQAGAEAWTDARATDAPASGAGDTDPSPTSVSSSSSAGPVTRTPRRLSFAERDRSRVQEALNLWSNGQRTEALETLDQFTLDNPQAHLSREMLGKLLLQRGESGVAMQVADIGLRIAPMHDGYRKLKARLLIAASQPEEALELLDDRPPSAEGDSEYHELLASAALAARQYSIARRGYESLLGTDESEGRWWFGLATALEGQGQVGNATRAYERARRSSSLSSRLRQRSMERIDQLSAQQGSVSR